ncbi:MAG TPA: hypothetical protein VGL62_00030 [Vicinamibacterales bacterium]|jgi:hypothetical protein
MTPNAKGLLVTAFYLLLFEAAAQTGTVSRVQFAARVALRAILLVLTVATVTGVIRHRRRFEPFGQDSTFREIGRWFAALANHF